MTAPTTGSIKVKGRIASLLEVGTGFHPELTGRENIFLNGAILGMTKIEIRNKFDEIVDFAGIAKYIDTPVKRYSSGMYVRLAFSVAINVDPDILVIDEALSVGDGAFARKSFDRIMHMRDAGKTILFCSHSLFQVESLCSRAIWINKGKIVLDGESAQVVSAYQTFLDKYMTDSTLETSNIRNDVPGFNKNHTSGSARLEKVKLLANEINTQHAIITSGQSGIKLSVAFASDPSLPCPNVGMTLQAKDGRTITSAATWEDQFSVRRDSEGYGQICLRLDQIPLLKGEYQINVYLLCERGIHLYDAAESVATLQVKQISRLQGYFSIPHQWENNHITTHNDQDS